jgi:5'-phosphate synthase pdxT subunit
MKIGVLALQGAVAEHVRSINAAGAEAVPIKKIEQLEEIDGLVLPGGESTTIGKLIKKYGFDSALKDFSKQQKPIFGTCAGLIIVAERIAGREDVHLGLMDITVERNAFGRQKESFETDIPVKGVCDDFRAVFIRAPYIQQVGPDVDVLSEYEGNVVAARQGHLLGAAFHPELTDDHRLHQYFVDMVKESLKRSE